MYEDIEPYENLANAIVEQAVNDYKKELHRLEIHPKNQQAMSEIARLERFFHSDWYTVLTNLSADQLLAGVKLLVKKEAAQKEEKAQQKRIKQCLAEVGALLFLLESKEKFSPAEQEDFMEYCEEAVELSEKSRLVHEKTDRLNAEAIRRVGFQVKE